MNCVMERVFKIYAENLLLVVDYLFVIRKEKSYKMQQCIKIFIIPYLYEAQHVSGNTPPIRSLKLH